MNDEIKRLPETYVATRIEWRLVERNGYAAIYTDRLGGYEVFKIRHVAARLVFGKPVPAHEAVPTPSEWGMSAWSYLASDRAGAMARFAALSAPEGSAPQTPGPARQEGECPADDGSNGAVACQLRDSTHD